MEMFLKKQEKNFVISKEQNEEPKLIKRRKINYVM